MKGIYLGTYPIKYKIRSNQPISFKILDGIRSDFKEILCHYIGFLGDIYPKISLQILEGFKRDID